MAKKAAKTAGGPVEKSPGPELTPKKTSPVVRAKKHAKAQAVAVAAAVETFVESVAKPFIEPELAAPRTTDATEPDGFTTTLITEANPVAEPAEVSEPTSASAAKAPIKHEDISRLAYQLYLERGGQNGSAADDWSRAEHMLRSR